jgi:multisubunit Na+/H+ antiporter MnhE subunit
MSRPTVRSVSCVALWTLAALGIWLLTLSALSWGELLVGAACSVGVGVIAVAAQRAVGRSWKPTAVSMRPFLVLPLAIASDAAQVLSLPLRSRRKSGHFETMDIDAAGSSPRIATRRALATLGTTVTPASIVVDVDDDGVMTLHSFSTVGVHMEQGFAKQ